MQKNEELKECTYREACVSTRIEKIPGIGQCDRNFLMELFEKVPSFLCCCKHDIQKEGSFEKVALDRVMRVIRLPEGTQYKVKGQLKTAGVGGVFIIEQRWLSIPNYMNVIDPYSGRPDRQETMEIHYIGKFSAYEADSFNKEFALERKEDASQKDVENTVRFIKAEKEKASKNTLGVLREMFTLAFLLKKSKIHQKGRVYIPVYDYYRD